MEGDEIEEDFGNVGTTRNKGSPSVSLSSQWIKLMPLFRISAGHESKKYFLDVMAVEVSPQLDYLRDHYIVE